MIKKRVSQSNRDTLFLFLLTHKQNERAFFEIVDAKAGERYGRGG